VPGNDPLTAALYARVSSEQQAKEQTIASQVEALRQRVRQDGLTLPEELCFLDEGASGGTLLRPALERLRDQAAAGAIDRLYVHSPDRLARKYAYQVLLLDELKRCGVEVVFLNRQIGCSPEEDLLLQVQGMVAEYERAKILERSRRGKLHAARRGSLNVLGGAPYGYRYVGRREGGGEASYQVVEEEARVVRQIFTWVGRDRCSIGEVCRRLKAQGTPSPKGKGHWDRTSVWGLLKNPAYQGTAAFGKTRVGEWRPRPRPLRGQPEHSRRAYSTYRTTAAEQIAIAVPALVEPALFAAVAEQLEENKKRQRGAPATCCKGWWSVRAATTPSTGSRSVTPRPRARPVTPTTAASARTPIASGASASATSGRCEPTCWRPPSGRTCGHCWPSRGGSARSTSVGSAARAGTRRARSSCGRGPRRPSGPWRD
jgi:site-specific DNA recombinase